MADSSYNKTVSSTNSVNLTNISFNTPSIAGYNKTVGSNSGSGSSGGRTASITVNLDALLTDNLDETVTSEKIENPKNLESYQSFGEEVMSFLGKVGCDIGGFGLGLLDGVLEFGEGLIDAALILGTAAVIVQNPILLGDLLITGISKLAGFEYNGLTQTIWADVVMPAVGYDISGAVMDGIYSIDDVAAMNENAHGPFKRGGGMYNVGKSVGTVTGTIALAVATGGTSIPLTVSTSSAVFAGMQKMGNSVESNYNKLDEKGKNDLGNIFAVNANGLFKGLIEGGTWWLTYGNGLGKAGKFLDGTKLGKAFGNFIDGTKLGAIFGKTGKTWLSFLTDDKAKVLGLSTISWVKGGLQATKTYANWVVDLLSIGSDKTFGEVTWDAAVNATISMFYDNAKWARKWFDAGKKGLEGKFKLQDNNVEVQGMELEFGEVNGAGNDQAALLKKLLEETKGNPGLTHAGSIIVEAYKKTGGTLIKKVETFLFDDWFIGGIKPYLKKLFGGA